MIRLLPILLLVATELVLSEAAVADIEKWIGPDGGVNYGDNAPPGADAKPVLVRPNVIETGWSAPPALADKQPVPAELHIRLAATGAAEQRRELETYIEQCRENRGVNCEREARWMIDGPAPLYFRGHREHSPRRAAKQRGPHLRLKGKSTHAVRGMGSNRLRSRPNRAFQIRTHPEVRRAATQVNR